MTPTDKTPRVSDEGALSEALRERAEGYAAAADMLRSLVNEWEDSRARVAELDAECELMIARRDQREREKETLAAKVRELEARVTSEFDLATGYHAKWQAAERRAESAERSAREAIAEARRDVEEARQFAERAAKAHNDLLLDGPLTVCVWCGHEFPKGTPKAEAAVLLEHANVCEKHPLRAASLALAAMEAERNELLGALERFKWAAAPEHHGGTSAYPYEEIADILSRPVSSTEALKEWGIKLALDVERDAELNPAHWMAGRKQRAAALVSRAIGGER